MGYPMVIEQIGVGLERSKPVLIIKLEEER
jgi:hypothetical protein